jgi:hypothetical protein
MTDLTNLNSTLQGVVKNLSQLQQTISNAFPAIGGSFTLTAATTTIVTQPAVVSGSRVFLTATNATAALTFRSQGLYHSANTPGASFSISTQTGLALGSETFEYFVQNG